jgi:hypothetical protein
MYSRLPQTQQIIDKIIVISRWWNRATKGNKLTPEQKKELTSRLKLARKNIMADISDAQYDIKQYIKELEIERGNLDKLKNIVNTDIEYAEEHIIRRFRQVK